MTEDFSQYNPEGSILRKAQQRMMEILKVIDAICQKHHIQYFLDGGSLIGAVRHSGFIPWDDDLDIAVMKEDFLKLRKILQKELPTNLVYQDDTTDPNYPLLIGKVRDKQSYFEEDFTDKLHYKGTYVDIIPMEKVPSVRWKAKLDYWYGHCFRALHNYTDIKDKIRSSIVFPFAWLLVQGTRLFNKFSSSRQIAHIYGWRAYNSFSYDDVFPVRRMLFENAEICVPKNPDTVLRALFGDYMQIPPKEKRAIHTKRIEFYD